MKIHAREYLEMMLRIILLMVFAAGPAGDAAGQDGVPSARATRHYEPTWRSLSQHGAAPQWYRDAVFGVYFHWGIYSVPGYRWREVPPRYVQSEFRDLQAPLVTRMEIQTEFGYHDFIPTVQGTAVGSGSLGGKLFKNAGRRLRRSLLLNTTTASPCGTRSTTSTTP